VKPPKTKSIRFLAAASGVPSEWHDKMAVGHFIKNSYKKNGAFLKKVFAIFDFILYNDRDTLVFLLFFY